MNDIVYSKKQEIMVDSLISTIVFISDLHFDFVKGEFCDEQSQRIKGEFIKFIKENYSHSILCIVGDCFNDYRKTLSFIQELEKEKILGFYVIGNHDFWNDGTKSYNELIYIFEETTKDFQYFRLLTTGRKYYIEDLCFIGDTGWTSFQLDGKQIDLSLFLDLPEVSKVKDFSLNQIISMHDTWIKFANKVLEEEGQVILLTHYPMVNFSKKPYDCWWSSETKLIQKQNCWNIFGHTHKQKQKRKNNVSAQRGYENKIVLEHYTGMFGGQQYSAYDFGVLMKTRDSSETFEISLEPLEDFYSPIVIQNPSIEVEMVAKIRGRGFKRCSKNREIFAELAVHPHQYLKRVKSIIKEYEKTNYIGYKYIDGLSGKTIHAVYTSITALERIFQTNDFSNPQLFVTAAIVTGFVYNDMPWEIDTMRPVDYYDVVRFYLVFQTMKHYNLDFKDITSIKKHNNRALGLANIEICLPTMNGKCLSVEEAYVCIKGTSLLTHEDESRIK